MSTQQHPADAVKTKIPLILDQASQTSQGAPNETFRSLVSNIDQGWKLLGSVAALAFGIACLKWAWHNDEIMYNTFGSYRSEMGLAVLGRAGTRLIYFLIGLALTVGSIAIHFA